MDVLFISHMTESKLPPGVIAFWHQNLLLLLSCCPVCLRVIQCALWEFLGWNRQLVRSWERNRFHLTHLPTRIFKVIIPMFRISHIVISFLGWVNDYLCDVIWGCNSKYICPECPFLWLCCTCNIPRMSLIFFTPLPIRSCLYHLESFIPRLSVECEKGERAYSSHSTEQSPKWLSLDQKQVLLIVIDFISR